MNYVNRPGPEYELQRLRDTCARQEHELAEAYAEIRRHHELIEEMATLLKAWDLKWRTTNWVTSTGGSVVERTEELLNREVGISV